MLDAESLTGFPGQKHHTRDCILWLGERCSAAPPGREGAESRCLQITPDSACLSLVIQLHHLYYIPTIHPGRGYHWTKVCGQVWLQSLNTLNRNASIGASVEQLEPLHTVDGNETQ